MVVTRNARRSAPYILCSYPGLALAQLAPQVRHRVPRVRGTNTMLSMECASNGYSSPYPQ